MSFRLFKYFQTVIIKYKIHELNYIFKWELKRGTNLYFVYSVFRGISGIKFNDISCSHYIFFHVE